MNYLVPVDQSISESKGNLDAVDSTAIPSKISLSVLQAVELREWGADGVIVGSALVKALGEASSPEEGLQQMTMLANSIRAAI